MGWKIFAVVFAVLTLLSATHVSSWTNLLDLLEIAMSIPAALGLLLFAFKLELFPRGFWWAFSRSYTVYSVVVIMTMVPGLYRQYGEGKSVAIVLGAFLLFGGLQMAVSVGLWLYALAVRPPNRLPLQTWR